MPSSNKAKFYVDLYRLGPGNNEYYSHPREQVPPALSARGVTLREWKDIYDYFCECDEEKGCIECGFLVMALFFPPLFLLLPLLEREHKQELDRVAKYASKLLRKNGIRVKRDGEGLQFKKARKGWKRLVPRWRSDKRTKSDDISCISLWCEE
eukprot:CAMPEP_0119006902 /NCGR_PEP_ID=MMETSP1176-20130426/2627_1 /TAXON_ID=265551 /ORGANISM="Synedropsis recta cf, Strain CCMP1620" /LENGTH=152 /DNA_ID=CAMNT_0006958931 /DNA_START=452 /DNA_END=910 /DNA_ORIENTATION=+